MPRRTSTTRCVPSRPIRSVNSPVSIVKSCVTLTTLAVARLPSPSGNNTLPGASARRRFDVTAHMMTVVSRLPHGVDWLISLTKTCASAGNHR